MLRHGRYPHHGCILSRLKSSQDPAHTLSCAVHCRLGAGTRAYGRRRSLHLEASIHRYRETACICIKTRVVVPARKYLPYPVPRLLFSAARHPAPVGLPRRGRCRAPNAYAAGKHLDVAATTTAPMSGRMLEKAFPYRSSATDAQLLCKVHSPNPSRDP